jgi:hypothetical protein
MRSIGRGSQLIRSGESMELRWTEGYSSAFDNILLIIIGAAYALAATMLIEAIRPLIEKRRR